MTSIQNCRIQDYLTDDASRHRRFGRRTFFTGSIASGLLVPSSSAIGQTSPPIEQRGDEPTQPAPQVIDPEPVPTISADEDAQSIIQAVGGSSLRYFAETGHNLDEPFLTAWSREGGESGPGNPISEPRFMEEDGVIRQDFETVAYIYNPNLEQGTLIKVDNARASQTFANDPAFLPAPPTLGTSWLVTADEGLRLRSGPDIDAAVIAVLPDNAEFIAAPGSHAEWAPGYVDGFSGWVATEFLSTRPRLAETDASNWRLDVWEGATLGESHVRREPTTASPSLRTLPYQTPVTIVDWVRGEPVVDNQITWAQLEDGSFVYARNIGRTAPVQPPPLPDDAPSEGRWIDMHLTQQLLVAYEGRNPVRTVVTTTGMPGWETPPGFFHINHRVANETMESGAIGAEEFYVLKNVLFTQYFTDRGHALHYAWWKNAETIGRPGSHGCLNLLLEDAQFFWDWATIGTPVLCRTV